MIQDSLASLARPVIVSKFRHDQFFSSHYDITTYLIKMDVIVRNAVYNSAQLRGSATGSIMTGEACADMAGIKVMLLLAAQKPDFDYDLFFRTFAHDYLTKDTLQMTYLRINDVHPICCLRINATLQQYDEFLNFYGITEGDGMYLAPDDRVNIW